MEKQQKQYSNATKHHHICGWSEACRGSFQETVGCGVCIEAMMWLVASLGEPSASLRVL